MPAFVDLTGAVYGRLTVLRLGHRIGGRHAWLCRCECGTEKVIASQSMRSGNTKSCGCLNEEVRSLMTAERNRANKGKTQWLRHGHKRGTEPGGSPTYLSWKSMKVRCDNPTGRSRCYVGIEICDRWRVFSNFLADMGERPEGMTLDRINPFGNYEPGNCRWATPGQQRMNTRKNFEEAGTWN
jgi:hypothetical protein